jgi:molecular chaperone DnaK
MTPLIERNTTIPTRKSEIFSTAEDNQTAVDIKVLQGERPLARDNNLLGQFRLEGIPSAPRGVPQVEVTFDIDANGILNVGAQDKATGREQKMTITASTNLSKDDIESMVRQAEEHAADDRRARELVDAKNRADTLVYQTEKTLRDLGDRLAGSDKTEIENQIRQVREAMEGDDVARLNQVTDQLQQASHALSQQLYQSQRPEPSADGGGEDGAAGSQPDMEDVVEGEFREA